MKPLLLLSSFLLVVAISSAQTYTVKNGSSISDVLTLSDIYQYPQFMPGTAFLKDGRKAPGKLNYNLLVAEVQFIDPKGDTLALNMDDQLQHLVIGKDTFYFDKGYLEQVTTGGGVKLAKRTYFSSNHQKEGAYGVSSPSSSSTSISTINIQDKTYTLKVAEDVILMKNKLFYFGDQNNHFYHAEKKNLLKLVPKNKDKVEDYLKANNVNFSSEDDLVKLVAFLKTL